MRKYLYILLLAISPFYGCFGQSDSIQKLEKQVTQYNDALQYEKSLALLYKIISDENAQPYLKYSAYLYKSYTYKRLFNYNQTLHNLDLALNEGLKSGRAAEVKNTIEAEKSFVYFDTQNYKQAEKLLENLKRQRYKYLSVATKSWLIMQDGYIKMLKGKYAASEQLLNEAFVLVAKNSPEDLPNIYGKKIELYNRMKRYEKRDLAFKEGLALSKKFKKIKYELYLYQIMRNTFQESQDFENAFYTQKKYDSISKYYDAIDFNSELELTEKKLEAETRNLKAQNDRYANYILYGVILSLLIILSFALRLYHVNKDKRILVENENTRIHHEVERLTKIIDKKGTATLELSAYNLTDRQKEIVECVRKGLGNKEIAKQLFISENTVKYHLKIIYEILDIEHRSAIRQ